jgi:hypothetical protein
VSGTGEEAMRSYEINVARVIDVKNSMALVQMKDKRTTHLMVDRVPRELLEKFKEEVKRESTV